jgi:O-antigen ligase
MRATALPVRVNAGALAGVLVAAAMATSSVVFSEPAVADMLMMGMILAIPLLGAARFGNTALLNLALWLVIVGLGLAAAGVATNPDTAIKHQLITLYLALGAFVLAGFVAADPVPRMRLVLRFYVVACLVATAAALAGYFDLVPGGYDLLTNYGRARGTFKDPNVYGAAVAPAIVLTLWAMLRSPARHAVWMALASLFMALGLLLSFSRGAWVSTGVSLLVLAWIALVRSRRRSDFKRFGVVAALGTLALLATASAALQLEPVQGLIAERASLEQSYDTGPEGRFGGQAKAVALILDNPLGIGTFAFRDTYHSEEPHNVYLSMFLNAGWVGGFLYIVSVIVTLLVGLRGAFRNGVLQGAGLVATAAFAGMAVEGLVVDTDHWRHFFVFMGCIWGLADALPPSVDPSRRRDDPPPRQHARQH